MSAFRMVVTVLAGSLVLCGLYSALDIKYGEKGFLCWSAFSVLVTALTGGLLHAAVAVALVAGGKAGGLEPFTVLVVSFVASKLLYCHTFRQVVDDVQVARRPCEEEIRDILFRHDPSRLHLVDAELVRYRGREKILLRDYEMKYAPPTGSSSTMAMAAGYDGASNYSYDGGVGGDGGGGDSGEQKSVVELAHEEETRRVQATIEASLRRITNRIDRRR